MDDQKRKTIAAGLRVFEVELGLPEGFLDRLAVEDDWSFVIKAHALVEATITHLLSAAVDPRLRSCFERLELSHTEYGKMEFARALELVSPAERRFIRVLSELRNRTVHDIRQVSFTFTAYVDAMDKNQRAAFIDALAGTADEVADKEQFRTLVTKHPRIAVWAATMQVLSRAIDHARRARALAVLREMATADWGRPQ
jgi:hypothetical protein